MKNPASGGGRWVEVPPERLVSWIVTFGQRHGGAGPVRLVPGAEAHRPVAALAFTAADGATAECHPPFPPLRWPADAPGTAPGGPGPAPDRPAPGTAAGTAADAPGTAAGTAADAPGTAADAPGTAPDAAGAAGGAPDGPAADAEAAAEAMVAHAAADRTVGVLLVRLGGYAVGVFSGSPPRLTSSKTGRRPVHGRNAAGGRSQHRFARRRENQAATALRAAADAAVGVFGPYGADGLDAVVLGGDKRSIAGLRSDPRLAEYLDRATDRFLTVPDPRPAVLSDIPSAYLAIRIRLTEP
jgi:Actinobacteria/chloroflexi VLRF1 release factor